MKRLLFLLLSVILFLTSCADFHDEPGKSVWSGQLWILPWVTALGAAASGYKFIVAYLKYQDYKKAGNKARLGYGWLIFSGALIIATIVIIISVVGNK